MTATNRGFLYGDGFFETIRIENESCPLLLFHLNRAKRTADFFEMEWKTDWTESYFLKKILSQKATADNVVRIDFYRSGEGKYLPQENQMNYQLSFRSQEFQRPFFFSNEQNFLDYIDTLRTAVPKPVAIYTEIPKPISVLSRYKSTSAAYYVKAALYLKTLKNAEDLILVNQEGRVCEALSSNIVVHHQNKWLAIPLSEGPVDSVYQTYLSTLVDITYQPMTVNELKEMDWVYLCNAVTGLVPVNIL